MRRDTVRNIFETLTAVIKNPRSELIYNSPFELLVAVILSAQATDTSVNKVTTKLFKIANTPEKIVALGLLNLKQMIQAIGLYNNKAKNILAMAEILLAKHGGKVPSDREALEALPGVGRKTANIILNVIFGAPTIGVDTHIFRVANRTGLATGKTPLAVEKKLMQVVPPEFLHAAHALLVLHGRYTCLARKPRCFACPIQSFCGYKNKYLPT